MYELWAVTLWVWRAWQEGKGERVWALARVYRNALLKQIIGCMGASLNEREFSSQIYTNK